jgi:hypothetical protein
MVLFQKTRYIYSVESGLDRDTLNLKESTKEVENIHH